MRYIYLCDNCGKSYSNDSRLGDFKCNDCGDKLSYAEITKQEWNELNDDEKADYKRKFFIKYPHGNHHVNGYKCPKCGSRNLNSSMLTVNSSGVAYSTPINGLYGTNQVYNNQVEWVCQNCGENFRSPSYMRKNADEKYHTAMVMTFIMELILYIPIAILSSEKWIAWFMRLAIFGVCYYAAYDKRKDRMNQIDDFEESILVTDKEVLKEQISTQEKFTVVGNDNKKQNYTNYDNSENVFCSQCGFRMPKGSRFCSRCGTQLPEL